MLISVQFNPESDIAEVRSVLDKLEKSPKPTSKPTKKAAKVAVHTEKVSDKSLDELRSEAAKATAVALDAHGKDAVKAALADAGLPRVSEQDEDQVAKWTAILSKMESAE